MANAYNKEQIKGLVFHLVLFLTNNCIFPDYKFVRQMKMCVNLNSRNKDKYFNETSSFHNFVPLLIYLIFFGPS